MRSSANGGSDSDTLGLRFRRMMVERHLHDRGIRDERILSAFMAVPRELFTPPGTPLQVSYGDHPVAIGFGQTVSQPFIVAHMIQLLDLDPGRDASLVLEVGTGSGYQTALLAEMGCRVVSLEVIPALMVGGARTALAELGLLDRVALIAADGYNGWEFASPYAGIIVSAAPGSATIQSHAQATGPHSRIVFMMHAVYRLGRTSASRPAR